METLTVVLTGGRSSRMGGRHKPALRVDGVSLVDRVVAAAPAGTVIVAGSDEGLTREAIVVREDPPFTGPLAGLTAALDTAPPQSDRVVLLLGGDMPFLDPRTLAELVGRAPAVAVDETGRQQFLCASWQEGTLRARIAELGNVAGLPLKRLFDGAGHDQIVAPPGSLRDIDTPEDAAAADVRADRIAATLDSAAPADAREDPSVGTATDAAGRAHADRAAGDARTTNTEHAGHTDTQPDDPAHAALATFWHEARGAVPKLPADPPPADRVWAFGATREHADELLALVLSGVKTGTAGFLWEYEAEGEAVPTTGGLDIILDGSGRPRAVIETTAVEIAPFDEVTAEHAHAEGEDDRTLGSWRRIHKNFYVDHIDIGRAFRDDIPVVCERFRLVYPPTD